MLLQLGEEDTTAVPCPVPEQSVRIECSSVATADDSCSLDDDPLAAARGILTAIPICVAFWGLVGLLVFGIPAFLEA